MNSPARERALSYPREVKMKYLIRSLIPTCALAAAGMLFFGNQAMALVLCVNSAGIVYAVEACGAGQTLANPIVLGLRGPKGDTGATGPAGPAGPAGAPGGLSVATFAVTP